MRMKNRKPFSMVSHALLIAMFAAILLCAASVQALAVDFHEDYEAIDRVAKSLLLLEVYDADGQMISTGSGFVAFDNRTLVTNHHVMEGSDHIIAYNDNGDMYFVTSWYAVDEENDIAILRFMSPTDLVPLEIDPDFVLLRGQPVVAIGSPKGVKNTVSVGNIGSFDKDEILYTAPVSPGSSGGALLNDAGHVIGLVYATVTESQNLNLAVPIRKVIALYEARDPEGKKALGEYGGTPAPTTEPTSTPTPDPTATPKPVSGYASNVKVKQTAADVVQVSWNRQGNSKTTYYVMYGPKAENSYWHYIKETSNTTIELRGFASEKEYVFIVLQSNTGKMPANWHVSKGVLLTTLKTESFSARGFRPESMALYTCNAGEEFWDAKRTRVSEMKFAKMDELGILKDLYFVIESSFKEADKDTKVHALVLMHTPDGQIIQTGWDIDLHKDESGTRHCYYITDLFASYKEDAGTYVNGSYTFELYYNGQFVKSAKLKVK